MVISLYQEVLTVSIALSRKHLCRYAVCDAHGRRVKGEGESMLRAGPPRLRAALLAATIAFSGCARPVDRSLSSIPESGRASLPTAPVGQAPEPPTQGSTPGIPDFAAMCRSIAGEIESLKARFPQLVDFNSATAIMKADCQISYTYRCHRSTRRGGWTAAVPNPDDDGLWFHIGLWNEGDPSEAGAQINTQPALPNWHIGSRRVTFLILEGGKTNKVASEMMAILERHGLR